MNSKPLLSPSKIGILILFIMIGSSACSRKEQMNKDSLVRFEKLVFSTAAANLADSIHLNYNQLTPFFNLYNEEVIKIGPDSLNGFTTQLKNFTNDSIIKQVYSDVSKMDGTFQQCCQEIGVALSKLSSITKNTKPVLLVTYISGFNQAFIALPGCLGIGLDMFMGADSPYYQELGIPAYIRKGMNPTNLPADGVRARLYSLLPEPSPEGGFLDRMIFEGKLYYLSQKLLQGMSDENNFHYTESEVKWCLEHEEAMWKYLAEQKILFSSDRLTIRKFMEEAPFTRDFGNESPGKLGVWIGYRIVSSYMKQTGSGMEVLIGKTDAREILSQSKYHP